MARPTDPFALVQRATEPRIFHKEWEGEERKKGPARGTGARGSSKDKEWEVVESKKGPAKGKGARRSSKYKGWVGEESKKGPAKGKDAKGSSESGFRFRLRCLNPLQPRGYGDYDPFKSFWRIDFHTVDLEKGEISLNSLPPMIGRVARGDMVSLDSTIYVLGGLMKFPYKGEPDPLPDVYHQYSGASCLDLSSSPKKWVQTARPDVSAPSFPFCVSLCGKIYSFGDYNCCPEVYDPHGGGQWKKLRSVPSGLNDCKFSRPVLPDPDENRILVHLKESRKLFAFYPHGNGGDGEGKWELITTGLAWEDVKAVADNIIYFYLESNDLVSAYDITKAKWLTCVWSSHAFLDILCFRTISPCPGNKGMMYLVGSGPARGEAITVAVFLKFRVQHIDNSILELTPVSLQSFRIPSTFEVLDFLAF